MVVRGTTSSVAPRFASALRISACMTVGEERVRWIRAQVLEGEHCESRLGQSCWRSRTGRGFTRSPADARRSPIARRQSRPAVPPRSHRSTKRRRRRASVGGLGASTGLRDRRSRRKCCALLRCPLNLRRPLRPHGRWTLGKPIAHTGNGFDRKPAVRFGEPADPRDAPIDGVLAHRAPAPAPSPRVDRATPLRPRCRANATSTCITRGSSVSA